jgi:sterol carrier protein 2
MAEKRQVKDANYALQHTVGLGGACVVAMYKKYKPGPGNPRPD